MTNISETFNQSPHENSAPPLEAGLSQLHDSPPLTLESNLPTADRGELPTRPNNFNRTVPHQALHAEREEHKKTRAALAQLRSKHEQMLSELSQVNDTENGQEAALSETGEAMAPDPGQDFLEFTRWQASEQQRLREEAEENQLWQQWQQSCAMSQAELPDLEGALTFLAAARDQQLATLGKIDEHFQDKKNRARQMQHEWRDLVRASLDRGENPALMIYELALGAGFSGHSRGEAIPHASERLRGLDEAQKAARTLAASNGRETGDPLLLENLAHLSEAEFARWYENNPDSFRRIFAG